MIKSRRKQASRSIISHGQQEISQLTHEFKELKQIIYGDKNKFQQQFYEKNLKSKISQWDRSILETSRKIDQLSPYRKQLEFSSAKKKINQQPGFRDILVYSAEKIRQYELGSMQKQQISSKTSEVCHILELFKATHEKLITKVQSKVEVLAKKIEYTLLIFKKWHQKAQKKEKQKTILMLNLKDIEQKYNEQIEGLIKHYEQKLKDQIKKAKKESEIALRQLKNDFQVNMKQEEGKYKNIINQSKKLINTKQQLIKSLTEQNQELRLKLTKTLTKTRTKSSPKKEQSQFLQKEEKKKSQQKQHDWSEFESDEVNYSDLDSVKDEMEWDISNLEIKNSRITNKSEENDDLNLMQLVKKEKQV